MRAKPFIRLLVSAFLAAGTLSSCGGRSASRETDTVTPEILRDLPGNYSMKMTDPSGTHYSTAVVKEIAAGQYQIARITVYGPVHYGFTLEENASVRSVELGSGTVSYKSAIKKTTIRFQKEEFVCELSK
jgi:hypothetical protein